MHASRLESLHLTIAQGSDLLAALVKAQIPALRSLSLALDEDGDVACDWDSILGSVPSLGDFSVSGCPEPAPVVDAIARLRPERRPRYVEVTNAAFLDGPDQKMRALGYRPDEVGWVLGE